MFGWLRRRLGRRPGLLDLEQRLARCLEERTTLRLEGEDLYAQFAGTPGTDEARGQARRGRLDLAAEALLEHFHDRIRPIFFLHYSEPHLLRPRLEQHPAECRAILQGSEDLLAHRFSPLGAEPRSFGGTIDWFSDFQDHSWGRAHLLDLREQFAGRLPMPTVEMGPIAVTWEFNRHSHFVHMGRAYWLTGYERFASEFIVQVVDWSERNRPLEGVNWLDPETVAARCINWLLALHMFLGSEQLTPDLLSRILSCLVLHGAILAWFVRTSEHPPLAAVSGLYILASSMPELLLSRRWLDLAGPALGRAAAWELGRDGLHRSGSVARHRLAVEWLLLPLTLHLLNRTTPPAGLAEAATASLDVLNHLRPPAGPLPDLGESASPGFLGWNCGASEHARRLLALGALTLRRGELRPPQREMPGELYWWCGPSAAEQYNYLPNHDPGTNRRLFSEVGLACARDQWEGKASWCLLRGAPAPGGFPDGRALPPSERENPAHHDDALSLCLVLDGEPFLIEPGLPPLQSPAGLLLSRVGYHSAPRLPGEPEPLICRPLSEGDPACREVRMQEREGGILFSATRAIWKGPEESWPLHRDVLFRPGSKTVIVRDRFEGQGEAMVESNLLLAPHMDILMRGDMGCLVRGKRLHARINPIFPTRLRYNHARGQTRPFGGWHWSEGRGLQPTSRLRYFTPLTLPATVYLWINWDPREPAVPRPRDLDLMLDGRRG